MKELREKIKKLKELKITYDKLKKAKAEISNQIFDTEKEIVDLMRDNMINNIEIDSDKIKAEYKNQYYIQGGQNPEKANIIIKELIEAGFLDSEKVDQVEKFIVNTNTLHAALRKAPDDMINEFIDKKLLSINQLPRVTIKNAE